MSAPGEVLFCRGQPEDEGSDIWDDTALIEAYDNAVSAMKAKMSRQMGIVPVGNDGKDVQKKKKKKGRRKHSRRKEKPASAASTVGKWKVGDHCRAVFTEDGQIYEAVILSASTAEETCMVRYLGYGNEEEQLITDLLPSMAGNVSDIVSETESMDWMHGAAAPAAHHAPRPVPRPNTAPRRAQAGRGGSTIMPPPTALLGNPVLGGVGLGEIPGMPPFPSFMPPLFPPNMLSMGMSPLGSLPGMAPTPPPMPIPSMPPPPVIDSDVVSGDDEALHSMLLSWYMSGYHTGYYQGLKQGKKQGPAMKKEPQTQENKTTPKDTAAAQDR